MSEIYCNYKTEQETALYSKTTIERGNHVTDNFKNKLISRVLSIIENKLTNQASSKILMGCAKRVQKFNNQHISPYKQHKISNVQTLSAAY